MARMAVEMFMMLTIRIPARIAEKAMNGASVLPFAISAIAKSASARSGTMPERDPATMTWVDAWRMIHRAYLHLVGRKEAAEARMLLINIASSIR